MSMNERNTNLCREKARQLGIAIIIPTYNNEKTLTAVIKDVLHYAEDVIVVNDGCTDSTPTLLKSFPGLQVIIHPINKGKGVALKNGLEKAKEAGYRYAITIDADGQHFASDIPLFIEEIEKEPDTLLVGARNLASNNMPCKNTFANKFSNFWFKLETGIALRDTQSGYRLYPLHRIKTQRFCYTAKYEFELEALVFAAWERTNVRNIPVHVYYPPQEERVSHFRPFRDFVRISILNTLLVIASLFWIHPRNFFRKLTWKNCRKFIQTYITQSDEPNRKITYALMLGIFMGIAPIWGYQILATLFLAHLLKLNKVIAVVAANISIPPVMPFLLYASYLTGCQTLGKPIELRITDISLENVKSVLEQYLIGSVTFAAACSILTGIISISLLTVYRSPRTR